VGTITKFRYPGYTRVCAAIGEEIVMGVRSKPINVFMIFLTNKNKKMQKRSTSTLLPVLLLLVASCAMHCSALTPAQITNINNFINNYMGTNKIVGFAIAVTEGDNISMLNGYGYQDLEKGIKVEPEKTMVRVWCVAEILMQRLPCHYFC